MSIKYDVNAGKYSAYMQGRYIARHWAYFQNNPRFISVFVCDTNIIGPRTGLKSDTCISAIYSYMTMMKYWKKKDMTRVDYAQISTLLMVLNLSNFHHDILSKLLVWNHGAGEYTHHQMRSIQRIITLINDLYLYVIFIMCFTNKTWLDHRERVMHIAICKSGHFWFR